MVAPGGDATRIPSTVVNGIGFLGGGAILRTGGSVHGLTTAAAIWVNAAIGMAAGAGHFVLAISGTCTALLVLTVLKHVEIRMDRYRPAIFTDTGDMPVVTPTTRAPDRREPPA